MEVEKRKMHCSKCGEEGHKRTSKKCKLYEVVPGQVVLPQEQQDTTNAGLEDDILNQVLENIEDVSDDGHNLELYEVVQGHQDVLPQEHQNTTNAGLEDDSVNQVLDDIEDKSSDDEYDLEEQTATIFIDENNTVQYIQCDDDSSEDEDNDCRVF